MFGILTKSLLWRHDGGFQEPGKMHMYIENYRALLINHTIIQ
jgi:hypothetical protein